MQAKRETVVITKRGKPVAKLIPADNDSDNIYNFLAGKGGLPAMSFPQQLGVTSGGSSSDSGRHARCRLAGALANSALQERTSSHRRCARNGDGLAVLHYFPRTSHALEQRTHPASAANSGRGDYTVAKVGRLPRCLTYIATADRKRSRTRRMVSASRTPPASRLARSRRPRTCSQK